MKKIFMYTLSTCPWCRKTKQFFKDRNIPFEYVDYDLASEAEQEKIQKAIVQSGAQTLAFPWVKIENEIVVGWNPERYTKLMGL